jgi:hypothetical protein
MAVHWDVTVQESLSIFVKALRPSNIWSKLRVVDMKAKIDDRHTTVSTQVP